MSLSKIRQARASRPLEPSKLPSDGFHCSFTFEPLKCHICELIPREAYTVDCCERNYCKNCISSLEQNYSTCPGCGKTITYSPNEKYNDVILRFEVYCEKRCRWKGPLGEHDDHLNIDPPDETWLNGCPKMTITCIHCKKWNTFKKARRFFLEDQGLKTAFSISKLQVVYSITYTVQNLWYKVGVALGFTEAQLRKIEQRFSGDSNCYQQVLKEWIESGEGANWNKLLSAFREPSVQFATLSRKVERMIVCGVASELEVKQLKEEAESLLRDYTYMDSSHTRDNMQKCYQSLNDEIQYLEWEENAKLLDKGFGESKRKRFHSEEGNELQVAAKMAVGGAALGTAAGVYVAGAAATTTAEFVVGGMILGPVGLAGGLTVGGIVGGITVALTLEQRRRRKLIEDKYTKLIDTCKEKINELGPKLW